MLKTTTIAHARGAFLVFAPPAAPTNLLSFALCVLGEKKIQVEERKRRRRRQLQSLRLARRRAGTRWPRKS